MTAPVGTRCTSDCRRPTQSQAHCSVCHRTFGGVGGFDAHRVNGTCADPTTKGMSEVAGVWVRSVGQSARFPVAGDAVEARTGEVGGIG